MLVYLFTGYADGCALLNKSRLHHDAHHDRVATVKDVLWEDANFAWENCNVLELVLFLFPKVITELHELVKQVVDYFCRKNPHTNIVRNLLRIPLDFYIKRQNNRVPGKNGKACLTSFAFSNFINTKQTKVHQFVLY